MYAELLCAEMYALIIVCEFIKMTDVKPLIMNL